MVLRAYYGMPSTGLSYGIGSCYGMPGNGLSYGLGVRYAMSGTRVGLVLLPGLLVKAATNAMRYKCAVLSVLSVLSLRMPLPGVNMRGSLEVISAMRCPVLA
eukprot:1028482-Rhodomonas_salina.2